MINLINSTTLFDGNIVFSSYEKDKRIIQGDAYFFSAIEIHSGWNNDLLKNIPSDDNTVWIKVEPLNTTLFKHCAEDLKDIAEEKNRLALQNKTSRVILFLREDTALRLDTRLCKIMPKIALCEYSYLEQRDMSLLIYQYKSNCSSTTFSDKPFRLGLTYVLAKPGTGKNSFINELNEDMLLSMDKLRIYHTSIVGMLDKGAKDHINPFDILIGSDKPSSSEKKIIKTILKGLLECEDGAKGNMLLEYIINVVYKENQYYQKGQDSRVDDALAQCEVRTALLTWNSIRDIFIEYNLDELALYAHRRAMPLLSDILKCLMSKTTSERAIRDGYMPLLKDLIGKINEIIDNYPEINQATEIESRNIIEIKLPGNFGKADKFQYMVSMGHACKEVMMSEIAAETSIKKNAIKHYIHKTIVEDTSVNKRIIADEIHHLDIHLRNDVFFLAELCRKQCEFIMVSQMLADFSKIGKDAQTVYLLGSNYSPKDISSLIPIFGVDENVISLLKSGGVKSFYNNSMGNVVSDYLAIFKDNHITQCVALSSETSPLLYWSHAASDIDRKLFKKVNVLFDSKKSRQILAERYPRGLSDHKLPDRKIKKIFHNIVENMMG